MDYINGLVSVIVPIYNGEKTLDRCLDSLCNQKYSAIEILLVDDGSQDDSVRICRKRAENDARIKIIQKNNSGVSDTRNYGLKNALGEFVVFVDCDDYVGSEYIDHLVKLMDEDVDFGICGWVKVDESGNVIEKCHKYNDYYKPANLLKNIVSVNGIRGYAVSKIFRNEIIKNNNIRFHKKLNYCEDLYFCCEYVKQCKNMSVNTNHKDYYYVINKNSTTYLSFYSDSFNTKWLSEIKTYENIIKMLNDYPHVCRILRARIALSSSFYINRMYQCDYHDNNLFNKLLRKLRKNLLFVVLSKEGDKKWRMQAVLCAISPRLEYSLKKMINRKEI